VVPDNLGVCWVAYSGCQVYFVHFIAASSIQDAWLYTKILAASVVSVL
jgi:hypothetical protein